MNSSFETVFQHWTVEAFIILGCGAAIAFTAFGLYCRNLRRLLRAVTPASRRLHPWQVWLLAIPLLHVPFMLLGADRLTQSLRAEATSRGIDADVRPTHIAGLAMAVAAGLCYVPHFHLAGTFAFVVCWILHWVKLAVWCGKLHCENQVSACERMLYEHRPFGA